jgi:ABC-type transport system involved in multi-copper enzyme maturation permease subunit
MAVHPTAGIKAEDWGRIGLIVLFSLVYISIFFLLGLLVSTLTHRGATSLLIILVLWVVWVIGAPNVGVLLAKRLSPVPESLAFMSEKRAIGQQRFDSQMDSFEAYWQADDRYIARVNAQMNLVQNLTRISPLASYVYVSTALARTGIAESQRYKRAVVDWNRSMRRTADREMREYTKRMEEYRAGRPALERSEGMLMPPKRPKDTYEREQEEPFVYTEMRLPEALGTVWVDVFLLLGFNVILFMAAYVSFIRYDVR